MSVRKNSIYRFRPVLLDHNYGEFSSYIVRVIELPGCPRARMPRQFAHIEMLSGRVIGMAHVNSLEKLTREQRKSVARIFADSGRMCDITLEITPNEWRADRVEK